MPDEPEVLGLLALMLLVDARRDARTDADGGIVLLRDQDRRRWDAALVAEGHGLVRGCLRLDRPGPYQVQAAIQAVHTDAPTAAATDWRQIVALYDQLLTIAPTAVVALHRAVAVAERDGPAAALALVDEQAGPPRPLSPAGVPARPAHRAVISRCRARITRWPLDPRRSGRTAEASVTAHTPGYTPVTTPREDHP